MRDFFGSLLFCVSFSGAALAQTYTDQGSRLVKGPAASVAAAPGALTVGSNSVANNAQAPLNLVAQNIVSGTDPSSGLYGINAFNIVSDTLTQSGGGFIFDESISYLFGTASTFSGNRGGLLVNMKQGGSLAGGGTIEGIQSSVELNNTWGGSNPAPGAAKGAGTALNPFITFKSGYVNGLGGSGEEIDVATEAGATFVSRTGLGIVEKGSTSVQGKYGDAAVSLGSVFEQGNGIGWQLGFSFGTFEGSFPIASDGTLIGTPDNARDNTSTVANAIYFPNTTVTGYIMKFPNFSVSGAGVITTSTNAIGVSCSGPPTSLFTVTNGIITHC